MLVAFFPALSFAQSDVEYYYLPANRQAADIKNISNKPIVPASLVKLVTAAHALFTFGGNHRFSTKIYLTETNELVFEGFGDPALTSTKLKACLNEVSQKLSANRIKINRVILDDTKFDTTLSVPGQGDSLNPYEAGVAALAINFNSVAVRVGKNQVVTSGEAETPLTNYAKQLAGSLPKGTHRLAIKNQGSAVRQFYEIVEIFLAQGGVKVANGYLVKPKPIGAKLIVTCVTEQLEDVIQGMLKYSNNFSANQIFLNTGARYYGYPSSFQKSSKSLELFMKEEVGISDDFTILEGAGLSRSNQLSPQQIIKLLRYFEPYQGLLPESNGLRYKSGTLNGVSNLAGYIRKGDRTTGYFTLFGSAQRSIPDRIKIANQFGNRQSN